MTDALSIAKEINQRFTSLNSVDVPDRAINETPLKEQTAEQIARLKVLRAECVTVHRARIGGAPAATSPIHLLPNGA